MNEQPSANPDDDSSTPETAAPTEELASPASNEVTAPINEKAETPKPKVEEKEPTIHLDQFLKTCGVPTGGQAKVLIQSGEILVNDQVETRRRKQLRAGDEVTLDDVVYVVTLAE